MNHKTHFVQRLNRVALTGLLVLAAPLIYAPSAVSQSQSTQESAARQFGSAAGQKVNDAQPLADTGQYSSAIAKLSEALALEGLSAYERSTILSIQGQYFYKLDNLAQAITTLEMAIQAGGLSVKETHDVEKHIALLYITDDRFDEGARQLELWVNKTGEETPEVVTQIVQGFVRGENYEAALPWAKKWFETARPKERKHFDLLNYIYYNTGREGQQADLLQQMIARWPDDMTLWKNWASLLGQSGREQDAFEVNKILYHNGKVTDENEIKKVVEYYQYYGMPFQAGQIMEKEMNSGRVAVNADNLVRLSELFRQAREYERALPILEKAAMATELGKSWAVYGEALYHLGYCEKAETVLGTAMEKGYSRGKSWTFIATCWYERGQTEPRPECAGAAVKDRDKSAKIKLNIQALDGFRKVPATSTSYGAAQKWLDFIQTENESFDGRCKEEAQIKKDICMLKIEAAYRLMFIRGEFILAPEDQYCMEYKEEYDLKYRQSL